MIFISTLFIWTKDNSHLNKTIVLRLELRVRANKTKLKMKKNNMLKMLEIIYDETNNIITASRANNYWSTVNEMTEESYNSVESFYLEFVHEFFKSIYKTK